MDCFPVLYFLSVSEGILAGTVEFIYNSCNWPEMLCVASLVCLQISPSVTSTLNTTFNSPLPSPPVSCLSVQPAFLLPADFKWPSLAQRSKNEEEVFCNNNLPGLVAPYRLKNLF